MTNQLQKFDIFLQNSLRIYCACDDFIARHEYVKSLPEREYLKKTIFLAENLREKILEKLSEHSYMIEKEGNIYFLRHNGLFTGFKTTPDECQAEMYWIESQDFEMLIQKLFSNI